MKQGCCQSLTLCFIYTDHLIKLWKRLVPSGTKLNCNTCINKILFADDQAIFQSSEDDLQRAIYKLHQLCQLYNMKISAAKTKTMAFKRKEHIRTKTVLDY